MRPGSRPEAESSLSTNPGKVARKEVHARFAAPSRSPGLPRARAASYTLRVARKSNELPSSQAGGSVGPEEAFDQRLERLEAIVAELERGDLGLEPSLERYQQGIALLRQCHAQLASYRARVQELSAESPGGLAPYAADPDAEDEDQER